MALLLKEGTILMEKHMVGGSLSQMQFLVLFIWLLYDVVDFASHVCNRLVHIGDVISLLLILKAPIATKDVCFSHLLKC